MDLRKIDPTGMDGGSFRHTICELSQSEQSAYEEAVSGHFTVPKGKSSKHYVPSCKKRHEGCKDEDRDREEIMEMRLDLQVLGASRQLYEEANYLLWATNTFSFDDSHSFNRFIGSLNAAQMRNLANLHIDCNLDGSDPDLNWTQALKMPYLNVLRGIQTLHLCFEVRHDTYIPWGGTEEWEAKRIKDDFEREIVPFMRLRGIPQKRVTVVVYDGNKSLLTGENDLPMWTVAEKNQSAESVRARLMDPRGAELVKADAIATRANSLRMSVQKAQFDLERSEDTAAKWLAEAVSRRTLAKDTAANALEAVKELGLAEEEGNYGGQELQENAESSALDASRMEVSALEAEQKAEDAQDKVDQKADKCDRAISRLMEYQAKNGLQMRNMTGAHEKAADGSPSGDDGDGSDEGSDQSSEG